MIGVFADVCCPFTHVGLRRVVAARRERAIAIRLRIRAWPIEWVNGAPLDPGFVGEEVAALREQVAPELFAGFDAAQFPATSIPALALSAVAFGRGPGIGEMVALLLRDRLFEQGDDIAAPDVLADIAARASLTVPDAEVSRRLVSAEYNEGRALGVAGSPHFFAGDFSTGDGPGAFCPTLRIRHDAAGFHITEDAAASSRLLDAVLGEPEDS